MAMTDDDGSAFATAIAVVGRVNPVRRGASLQFITDLITVVMAALVETTVDEATGANVPGFTTKVVEVVLAALSLSLFG